ncbi:MAG: hypothetical protein K2Q10_05625 [Rhodospirillales bacterium]|nr:hypothetical protein [Rhodospirillales bacterium]
MNPRLGFVGLTHLGVVSAAAASAKGFATLAYDADAALADAVGEGRLPVAEPGLDALLAAHPIRTTADPRDLQGCDLVYFATDVPTDEAGSSNLAGIEASIAAILPHLAPHAPLVVLCQVPPGFTRRIALPPPRLIYQVETLVFGRAVERALEPERFILGLADPAQPPPEALATFLAAFGCPVLPMRYESAELCKIAINCCLAASVGVANTLAELSEGLGADWAEIVPALKLDRRIGSHAYLAPGLGLAGGNIERDLATVRGLAAAAGSDAGVIAALVENSRHRRDWALRVLHERVLNHRSDPLIGILGLAYKEDTASTRNSQALALIAALRPFRLRLHDPVVPAEAAGHPRATPCATPIEAARGADALVLMTPWPHFRGLDPAALRQVMAGRVLIDPHRLLDGAAAAAAGFHYHALGQRPLCPGEAAAHA